LIWSASGDAGSKALRSVFSRSIWRSASQSLLIAGELAAGRSLGANRETWEALIDPFRFLDYSREVGWYFGLIYRQLQERGTLIGANDLWIAATALAHDLPLVTRNAKEFGRIRDLDVRSY